MAEMKGKLVTCDRCGESVFLKVVGEGEADGGYTRWNKFEPMPEGWKYRTETGQLCRCCSQEFTRLLESFIINFKED